MGICSDPVCKDPQNLCHLQKNHLQLNHLQLLLATCRSTTCSRTLATGHLQQNMTLAAKIGHLQQYHLQRPLTSTIKSSVLFLLQVSYFAASDLLQEVELQVAKKVAASGFATNGLNLGGP